MTVKGRVSRGIGEREPEKVKAGAEDSAEHGPGVEPLKQSRRQRARPVISLQISEAFFITAAEPFFLQKNACFCRKVHERRLPHLAEAFLKGEKGGTARVPRPLTGARFLIFLHACAPVAARVA